MASGFLSLSTQVAKLYHMGLSAPVKRTTLAEANERHDWRIFAEFAQCLIDEARGLYADEPFGIDLAGSVYAFDASTIDLCLSLFPWAHFGRAKAPKASIKLHTLLDLRGNIPSFIHLANCQHRGAWLTCVASTSCRWKPVRSM